tara:strand:- start:593 stop:805 length:213 start_codon:yes stop_codon:yes gene_type:complete
MIKKFNSFKTDNSKSLIFTVVYTTGHFFIAVICAMYILDADFNMASINALLEPLINAVWLYLLHRFFLNL